ncbi:F-box DNA helicase 1-like isoform X1 [Oscarella lobularis]|uniref:F-box DNA helicase 1-like isoform X1 n=1 Tax=Oscarella lobularis TaxID=121494 RepID=UPI0033137731
MAAPFVPRASQMETSRQSLLVAVASLFNSGKSSWRVEQLLKKIGLFPAVIARKGLHHSSQALHPFLICLRTVPSSLIKLRQNARSTGGNANFSSSPDFPLLRSVVFLPRYFFNLRSVNVMSAAKRRRIDQALASPLPPELLENIFCHLPLSDLLLGAQLTCKQWHSVIANEEFMLHKKTYKKFEKDGPTQTRVSSSPLYAAVVGAPDSVLKFASLVKNFRSSSCYPGTNVGLQRCRLFKIAQKVLNKLNGDSPVEGLFTWSLIFLLVAFSHTVQDCCDVIQQITFPHLHQYKSKAFVSTTQGLDFLYYVATYLKALREPCQLTPGIHYRLYYALYQGEKAGRQDIGHLQPVLTSHGGQQSIQRYFKSDNSTRLTREQVAIINHKMKPGHLLKIVALAGAGKTTTLVEYTKLRPDMKFLVACYNKSVRRHAQTQFPKNVECRTLHSLAYAAVGRHYKGKLNEIKAYSVASALGIHLIHSKRTIDTLNCYIATDDDEIKPEHVPADIRKKEPNKWGMYVEDARRLWECSKDVANRSVNLSHDGYLKLWQLSRPQIKGFDCLLIDEAQDITPAVASVLSSQETPQIMVGDPHQQIYGFKGAENVLTKMKATHTYYLTQSFRFGSEIAYVAACLLDDLKGVRNRLIVGTMNDSGVLGDTVGQIAVIARLNYTLFNEAVRVCQEQPNVSIGFVGGIRSYSLDRILDIYWLFSGSLRSIKDPLIEKFSNFGALQKYALNAPDNELVGKLKTVETHHSNIPAYVKLLKDRSRPEKFADIVFSTTHKAKGLEFSTVRVLDDFLGASGAPAHGPHPPTFGVGNLPEDEYNLLYVAATRAKKRLRMSRTLFNILKRAGEKFVVPVEVGDETDGSTICSACKSDGDKPTELASSSSITIQERKVVLENGVTAQEDRLVSCRYCKERLAPFYTGM